MLVEQQLPVRDYVQERDACLMLSNEHITR